MKDEIANKSIFFREHQLLPCPFCGGEVSMDSCDRIISFICEPCGYRRSFHGLVQSEFETPVVASYIKGTKTPLEWYDKDAYERAAEAWNKRADIPIISSWPQPILTSTDGPIVTVTYGESINDQ